MTIYSKSLAVVFAMSLATPAFAGGGCSGWGHAGSASVAAAEPAASQAVTEETMTLLVSLDCTELTGEQYETCVAAQSE